MARLWDKVDFRGPAQCWIWTGARNRDGYGSVGDGRGGTMLAHRASWQRAYGDIPTGKYVLHRCDEPSCINPTHLFLGTQADNVADCARKGRRNQSRPKKITPAQKEEIIALYGTGGYSLAALGRKFGVTYQTIKHHLGR